MFRLFFCFLIFINLNLAHAESFLNCDKNSGTCPDASVRLMVSPYTFHYSRSDEHKNVVLIGAEREAADGALTGAAIFSNSFGQTSAYIYPWGQIYRNILGNKSLFVKWSAGLLYGYREPYENKIPLNYKGFAPAILPTLGFQFQGNSQAQVVFLGTSALMFQLTVPLN